MTLQNMMSGNYVVTVPHARSVDACLERLHSSTQGLSVADAAARLSHIGPNTLPRAHPPSIYQIFIQQFISPLIYILLVAAMIALAIQSWLDAIFILGVLLINAVVGTYQEYGAERSMQALQRLITLQSQVLRAGNNYLINAEELVPGDIVYLQSGTKVPADLRLLSTQQFAVDESMLTGESVAVHKDATLQHEPDCPITERSNMAFAGSIVTTGRATAIVVATALNTELGVIAASMLGKTSAKPPLLQRMQRFARFIAMMVGLAVVIVASVEISRGRELTEIFLVAVALAVAAIPEGLTVAMTVALAVGMQRMARRHVIVRRLLAVESLGSCTYIATDKTGTLTVNQITVRRMQLPGQPSWKISGEGVNPNGGILFAPDTTVDMHDRVLRRLCAAAIIPNEGKLYQQQEEWIGQGDTVDVALLVFARKAGYTREQLLQGATLLAELPYESALRYAASHIHTPAGNRVLVKGAVETILAMCQHQATNTIDTPLHSTEIIAAADLLAEQGFRILAVADGVIPETADLDVNLTQLHGLCFLGILAMDDPLRPEVKEAVTACRLAGVKVAMITGDHPVTALSIAKQLNLAHGPAEIVTSTELADATRSGEPILDHLTRNTKVYARAEPQQKLAIVQSLQRQGEYVAVTGDGVNDAPAIRAAHVGVAMGKVGTDVARETADIIITDDNFASIVAGIEEGRVAYKNIRKVIFLLISTGLGELVLFFLALSVNTPLPLTAIQLLWLNLVTNGVQDIALAFEPAEGDELNQPPRTPHERIFNALMIQRVSWSALVIGIAAFSVFYGMLQAGYSLEAARNSCLMLMVLFENVQTFNSRSERRSLFVHNPLRNPLLLYGTLGAQLIHIGAMYTPVLSTVLGAQPVSLTHWSLLFGIALILLVIMEFLKWLSRHNH